MSILLETKLVNLFSYNFFINNNNNFNRWFSHNILLLINTLLLKKIKIINFNLLVIKNRINEINFCKKMLEMKTQLQQTYILPFLRWNCK